MKKIYFYLFTASAVLIILIFFSLASLQDHKLHIVVCDVGQGDAIFITTPRQAQILIDGGPDKSVLSCLASHMPFWDRSLDMVIMTHPDADHSTGLVNVVERYNIDHFYTQEIAGRTDIYKLLMAKLAEKKLSAKYLRKGQKLNEASGFSMTTLWPSSEGIERIDQNKPNLRLNEIGVVELVNYRKFTALLTADAGSGVMDQIAGEARSINILKFPHHGSKTGMSDYFLTQASPDLAVVSVGANNRYGHPASESLALLKDHGVKTLRTDQHGEVEIISDGLKYSVLHQR